MRTNHFVKLAQRPVGAADASTWNIGKAPVQELQDGQFLTEIKYISLDPAMRGWLNDARSYIPPVQIGAVMRAGTIGEVVESKNPKFKIGDTVSGWQGVQSYAISDGSDTFKTETYGLPLPKFISVLGMPGFTAYFGLMEIGQPKAGETLVVSGAAGAVGSVVGQIGKIKGLRVVGIAGGADKCKYVVDELGFDACIDYKNENVGAKLKEYCPDRVDIYFDNVGGDILDAVLGRLNNKARIPICGAISQYNNKESVKGPSNYLALLVSRARMEGFVVMDYAKDYGKAAAEMGKWMAEGKLKSREHIEKGIENFPTIYNRLFSGEKMGKLVLEV